MSEREKSIVSTETNAEEICYKVLAKCCVRTKSDAIVKYTLTDNNTHIFDSQYMTYIPSEEELKRS